MGHASGTGQRESAREGRASRAWHEWCRKKAAASKAQARRAASDKSKAQQAHAHPNRHGPTMLAYSQPRVTAQVRVSDTTAATVAPSGIGAARNPTPALLELAAVSEVNDSIEVGVDVRSSLKCKQRRGQPVHARNGSDPICRSVSAVDVRGDASAPAAEPRRDHSGTQAGDVTSTGDDGTASVPGASLSRMGVAEPRSSGGGGEGSDGGYTSDEFEI